MFLSARNVTISHYASSFVLGNEIGYSNTSSPISPWISPHFGMAAGDSHNLELEMRIFKLISMYINDFTLSVRNFLLC